LALAICRAWRWQHTVPTNTLWGGSLALLGFNVGYYLPAHPAQARPAAEAHRRLENGAVGGRILLTP
jgi:NADPH2:quinone reductase